MSDLVSISKPISFDTGTTYGTAETLIGLRYRHARRKPLRTASRTGVEHKPPAPTQLRFLAREIGPAGHIPAPGRADQNAARALAARGLGTCVYDARIKARVVGFRPTPYALTLIPTS